MKTKWALIALLVTAPAFAEHEENYKGRAEGGWRRGVEPDRSAASAPPAAPTLSEILNPDNQRREMHAWFHAATLEDYAKVIRQTSDSPFQNYDQDFKDEATAVACHKLKRRNQARGGFPGGPELLAANSEFPPGEVRAFLAVAMSRASLVGPELAPGTPANSLVRMFPAQDLQHLWEMMQGVQPAFHYETRDLWSSHMPHTSEFRYRPSSDGTWISYTFNGRIYQGDLFRLADGSFAVTGNLPGAQSVRRTAADAASHLNRRMLACLHGTLATSVDPREPLLTAGWSIARMSLDVDYRNPFEMNRLAQAIHAMSAR